MTNFKYHIQEMLELNKLQLLVSLDKKVIEQLHTLKIKKIDIHPKPKMKEYLLNVSFSMPTTRHRLIVELFKEGDTYSINQNPTHRKNPLRDFFELTTHFTNESELFALNNFLEKVAISIWKTISPYEEKSKEGIL